MLFGNELFTDFFWFKADSGIPMYDSVPSH